MAWRSRMSPWGGPPFCAAGVPSSDVGSAPSAAGAATVASSPESPRRRARLPISKTTVRPLGRCCVTRRKAARHDLRYAVIGHGYAVQRIRRVHRALLVRDDDELRAVGVAAQQREEAVDVEVVERGLDLVEDVERARLGQEDREEEGDRGHRLLAAAEQREALGRLARRRDLDLDPVEVLLGELLAGVGLLGGRLLLGAAEHRARAAVLLDEAQAPAAPGEDVLGELLEVLGGRVER